MEEHPALFLDRDGVINVDHGYVCSPQRTEFIEGIFELVQIANRCNHVVVVITNQAGIARGFYTEADFGRYMEWMAGEFARHGARLDAVYYCPHHPVAGRGEYLASCGCRKPAPGMILAAKEDLALDLANSILVGDKPSDMAAGEAAGIGVCIPVGDASEAGLSIAQELRGVAGLLAARGQTNCPPSRAPHALLINTPSSR
jgi:D-glycero-D-manno-heptose 1,7-bisphosphate phosphatase